MPDKLINDLEEGIPSASDFVMYDPGGSGYYKKSQVGNLPGGGGSGAITLVAPSLSAAGIDADTIRLTIGTVANETSIEIQRSNDGSTGWATINTAAANTTSYDDNGLAASTTRHYRVRSVGDGVTYLTSGWSSSANGTTSAGSSFDSDAAAFFASTGSLAVGSISDSTAKNAVNQLVVDLKAAGLWTNMKALYPFVGGSSTTQKFNLKNPADTNGAFRMTWVGSDYTFDQTGVVIGAASLNNSYGNTNFNLASQVSNLNAFATGFYRRGTGFNSLYSPISTYSAAGSRIILGVIGTDLFVDFWDFSQRLGSISVSDMNGLISLVRTANNDMKLYRGATAAATQTATNTGTLPNLDLFCGATNDNGTPSAWNVANNLALFYMYDGALTGSNMTALSAAVDTFQTALSRNV